jgi:phosphatidylglycerol:prolipoprotein diacylglycerol transferase
VAPVGLGLGRVANFINGELYGRIADVPWAVVFPRGGDFPRHPSQLYEGFLEGLVLFILMYFLARVPKLRARPGYLSGVFLCTYGVFRFSMEFFREPDQQIGFILGYVTLGQLLCLPMVFFGLYLVFFTERRTRQRQQQ